MARPKSDDPLVPVPIRLPSSIAEELRARADAAGCTVSDVLRSQIQADQVKPLGKVRPAARRAKSKLAAANVADPEIRRVICTMGNNLNQLAKCVNSGALTGTGVQCNDVLGILAMMQNDLARVAAGLHAR